MHTYDGDMLNREMSYRVRVPLVNRKSWLMKNLEQVGSCLKLLVRWRWLKRPLEVLKQTKIRRPKQVLILSQLINKYFQISDDLDLVSLTRSELWVMEVFVFLYKLVMDDYTQRICRRVCRLVCRHAQKQAQKAQDYSKTFQNALECSRMVLNDLECSRIIRMV